MSSPMERGVEDTRMSTPLDETNILTKYTPFINHTVTHFMSKLNPYNRNGVLDAEDLKQEVIITILTIIRKDGEEALHRNRLTFIHVMWEAVRKAYPLSIPYHAFGKQHRQPLNLVSFEEWYEDPSLTHEEEPDTIFHIMIDQLPELQRTIIRMKLDGRTQREIAHVLGMSNTTMNRMYQRLKSSIKTNI